MKPEKTFPEDKIFEIKNTDLVICSIGEKKWMDCYFFRKGKSLEPTKLGVAKDVSIIENKGKTRVYPSKDNLYIHLSKGSTCSWVEHQWSDTVEVYCQREPTVKMKKPSDIREDEYLQSYLDQIKRVETDSEKITILNKIYSDGFEDGAREGWE